MKEVQEIEEFKKTAVYPTFEIFEFYDERWTVLIHGPIDSKFEGMFIEFLLDFNNDYPFSAPTITCLETVEGTFFKKKEVVTFDYLSMKSWSPAMRILTILISIQSYMASIKPIKGPVSQERIQEPRNELNSVNGRKPKAKKERKAARKRASTSTTSQEPARKKPSNNIQQALPESSQPGPGESQAVDEKIKAARIKAQKVKDEYDASLNELDVALEEKLKTHEAELLEVQRKIQETLEKRKKLREDLKNL